MAIRRPLIDMIDRGMDPRVAHSKVGKDGRLIIAGAPAKVIVDPPKESSNLLTTESESSEKMITEEKEEKKEDGKEKKDEVKPTTPKAPVKSDKSLKPV